MPLLPESTNDRYDGSVASCRFLALLAVLTIVPGSIHAFLPDGGAVTIAGLDLGPAETTIIGLFAWAGATQIVHGLAMLAVALRYRTLVPFYLALVVVERIVMTLNWWVLKPGDTGHRPPEVYATLVMLPLVAWFLVQSLGRRGNRGPVAVRAH
jgi:hypothetical protein